MKKAFKLTLTGDNDSFDSGSTYTNFRIDGGAGNDQLFTSFGNDSVNGGAGNDYLYSQGGNDVLSGGAGDDIIVYGGDWKATLSGGAGNDWIADYGGSATLSGGNGWDTLVGTGRDVMIGGKGGDLFTFAWTGRPIEADVRDFNIGDGDRIDLGPLGIWWYDGYHGVTEADLEVNGKDLVVHAFLGDATIMGVGEQIQLIGIADAVSQGVILLDGAKG